MPCGRGEGWVIFIWIAHFTIHYVSKTSTENDALGLQTLSEHAKSSCGKKKKKKKTPHDAKPAEEKSWEEQDSSFYISRFRFR